MSSRKSISHDELVALLQLRMLRVPDATLNVLLPKQSPVTIARKLQHQIDDTIERRVASAMRELDRMQVGVVTVADARYPAKLHELNAEKPPILFYRGDWSLLDTKIVAIVGTRRSTEYGNGVAQSLAGELTRYGITIISGLALGIDAHAHSGALEYGGKTVAVLGCGIDVHYPQRNARLQERIANEGLLISEFAPGEPAMKHHFMQRNRLIAKLAGGVIVVEAGLKSGSNHTVNWAITYGVEVFAVPGPIGREASLGTNALIFEGANMVISVRDVIEQLPWDVTLLPPPEPTSPGDLPSDVATLIGVLGPVAMQIDEVARAAGCDAAWALAALAELELEGLVEQLPGKRFVRVEQNC